MPPVRRRPRSPAKKHGIAAKFRFFHRRSLRPLTNLEEAAMAKSIRRDRRRRALRRFADGDAARPAGLQRLVVDRATFPSDTRLDPHRASARRRRAGAMGPARPPDGDRLPADRHLRVRLRPVHDRRRARHDDSPVAYCPRRTVLDKLLVDAAAEAGAEVREGFTVEDVVDRGRARRRHPRPRARAARP